VVLCGDNGSGKTTLLLLLLGVLRPKSGSILVDGVDLAEIRPHQRRALFAWVPQTPILFADTIAANVTLGVDVLDSGRIRTALDAAGATALVAGLPGGADMQLAEGGDNLSGGERQRLCLARALYRRAPFLLLDEPTANLDEASATALARTLEDTARMHTTLVVTHDEDAIRGAERVVVLDDGRVVQDCQAPCAAHLASG
jgi:ABC-type multidrug transport system fused ATPase/permease subunit